MIHKIVVGTGAVLGAVVGLGIGTALGIAGIYAHTIYTIEEQSPEVKAAWKKAFEQSYKDQGMKPPISLMDRATAGGDPLPMRPEAEKLQ